MSFASHSEKRSSDRKLVHTGLQFPRPSDAKSRFSKNSFSRTHYTLQRRFLYFAGPEICGPAIEKISSLKVGRAPMPSGFSECGELSALLADLMSSSGSLHSA